MSVSRSTRSYWKICLIGPRLRGLPSASLLSGLQAEYWQSGLAQNCYREPRIRYTGHITFDEVPAVRDLAARAQARLAGLPGLDLVPARWLHFTTQGVGFTVEVASG